MNLNEVVSLLQIQGGAKLVAVQFQDASQTDGGNPPYPGNRREAPAPPTAGRHYTYKCLTVPDIGVNDLVVVEARGGMAVAKVVGIIPVTTMADANYESLKHVICKVDMRAFVAVEASENQAREALAMAEINDRLTSVRKFMSGENLTDLQHSLAPVAYQIPWTPPAPGTPSDMEAALRAAVAPQAGGVIDGTA